MAFWCANFIWIRITFKKNICNLFSIIKFFTFSRVSIH